MSMWGLTAGVAVGDQLNREDRVRAAESSLGNKQEMINVLDKTIETLELSIDEWKQCVVSLFNCQVRTKADYEGLKAVTLEILREIRKVAPSNSLLIDANRDRIFGAAYRAAEEANKSDVFSQEIAQRAGMLALIDAAVVELKTVSPANPLNDEQERYITYLIKFTSEWDRINFRAAPEGQMKDANLKAHLLARPTARKMFEADPRYFETASDETLVKKAKLARG